MIIVNEIFKTVFSLVCVAITIYLIVFLAGIIPTWFLSPYLFGGFWMWVIVSQNDSWSNRGVYLLVMPLWLPLAAVVLIKN